MSCTTNGIVQKIHHPFVPVNDKLQMRLNSILTLLSIHSSTNGLIHFKNMLEFIEQ